MKRLRILVVEDDGIVAYLLGLVLEDMGHEVCAIESNEAGAVEAARCCKPDLMIVDENLGRESGLAVIDALLQDGAMPHIFVSGDTARILTLRPLAVVLEKPYFETDLEQAIQLALTPPSAAADLDPLPVDGRRRDAPAGGPA